MLLHVLIFDCKISSKLTGKPCVGYHRLSTQVFYSDGLLLRQSSTFSLLHRRSSLSPLHRSSNLHRLLRALCGALSVLASRELSGSIWKFIKLSLILTIHLAKMLATNRKTVTRNGHSCFWWCLEVLQETLHLAIRMDYVLMDRIMDCILMEFTHMAFVWLSFVYILIDC